MDNNATEQTPTRSAMLGIIKEMVEILAAYRGDRLPIRDTQINGIIARAHNMLFEADGKIPTQDEIEALQRFSLRYGKHWKETLLGLWINGIPAMEPDGGTLQRIRNRLGPTWLQLYHLPEPG